MTSAEVLQTLDRVWEALGSLPAQRAYVLAAGIAALAFALWTAWQEHRFLDRLSAAYFNKSHRGRKPILARTIRRREREAAIFRRHRWRAVWGRVGKLLALGVVTPTILLAAGAHFYRWFDADGIPFVIAATRQPIDSLSHLQMAMFVVDELMRGGFLDVMEVFDVQPLFVTHNPENFVFSCAVLLYRTFVAVFEPTVIWFGLRAWWIARQVRRGEFTPAA